MAEMKSMKQSTGQVFACDEHCDLNTAIQETGLTQAVTYGRQAKNRQIAPENLSRYENGTVEPSIKVDSCCVVHLYLDARVSSRIWVDRKFFRMRHTCLYAC